MDSQERKIGEIFSPYYLTKYAEVNSDDMKFVQYTSAFAAMNIIKGKEVWLRNTQCMNDFSEVKYGLNCLVKSINNSEPGENFKLLLNDIFPGFYEEFSNVFDSWIPSFINDTYIACLSEHQASEEQYGRLSMWRAYGGDVSVALVLNTQPFMSDSTALKAYTSPIIYLDLKNFPQEITALSERIKNNKEFIKDLGKNELLRYLFHAFQYAILCTKHPGFHEEKEWRVIYNPSIEKSELIKSEIEVIDNMPQKVCKIPLIKYQDPKLTGTTIPDLIEKIIIGPNINQQILGDAFIELLNEAGYENSRNKIVYSGIPLR